MELQNDPRKTMMVESPKGRSLEHENPMSGLKEDFAVPDTMPLITEVAQDTPEVRMALRNEARSRVLLGERDFTGVNLSVLG